VTLPLRMLPTALYESAEFCEVSRSIVTDPAGAAFAASVTALDRRLGDDADDPFWRESLRGLKRIRFDFASTPLPFNDPALEHAETIRLLHRSVKLCESLFPQHSAALAQTLELAVRCSAQEVDPMGTQLMQDIVTTGAESVAVLLKTARYHASVARALRIPGRIELIGEAQLAEPKCFDAMFVCGPPQWYPVSLLSAPRASSIKLIHFSWSRDVISPMTLFDHSRTGLGTISGVRLRPLTAVESAPTQDLLEPDGLLPNIHWRDISASLDSDDDGAEIEDERVPAILLLLAGGYATYVEATDEAFVYALDPSADPTQRIRRCPTQSIEAGLCVLLRSEGGGDHISAVADQILGAAAAEPRAKQADWKRRLRQVVDATGFARTSDRLKAAGALRASPTNIRHWMGRHSLRTEEIADFAAVMKVINLEAKTADYWQAMALLDRAHRSAGFFIRRLLLRQVLRADLQELQATGRMDFQFEGGGTLGAFRVEHRAPDAHDVPVGRLAKPIKVASDLWLG
jgi:hypothetical protein